jgi:hypothetical protein
MAASFAAPHAAGTLGSSDELRGGSWGVTAG